MRHLLIEDLAQLIYDLKNEPDGDGLGQTRRRILIGTIAAGAPRRADLIATGDSGGTGASPLSSISAGIRGAWPCRDAADARTHGLRGRACVCKPTAKKTVAMSHARFARTNMVSRRRRRVAGCVMMRKYHLSPVQSASRPGTPSYAPSSWVRSISSPFRRRGGACADGLGSARTITR